MKTNHFEEKRLLSFKKLETKPLSWERSTIINFQHFTELRTSDKGNKVIEKWIPVYQIPEGYINPYEKDVEISDKKRCQICDTKLIHHGIIIHKEKKYFLVVGSECYKVYEQDNDRSLKMKMIKKLRDEYNSNLIDKEKEKILSLLKDNNNLIGTSINDYSFHSTIIKDRWLTWKKGKFNSFIVKHAKILHSLGYEPNVFLSCRAHYRFNEKVEKEV